MNYEAVNNDIVLCQKDLDLDETLDCGQAFRWSRKDEKTYCGYFLDRYLEIEEFGDEKFIFRNTSEEEFLNVWADYFDLHTDYGELKKRFSEDSVLAEACKFAGGIRLLKQDAWECLCSFIISQNNNIPRIKGIISRLCERFGGFPGPDVLAGETAESLGFLRSGFRAAYIADAAYKVSSGITDLEKIKYMSHDEAGKKLMEIKGVGPKVSECVLLFGMYRTEAFPEDVWIKRVMASFYPDGMPECTKGFEGIAQQYLFHFARNHGELLK